MSISGIVFIAFSLALDAFAVSVSSGVAIKKLKINNAFKIALFFGSFQAIMPVIGWFAGLGLKGFISGIDHWIVFGLLSLIGTKMIYESFNIKKNESKDPLGIHLLFVLAIATSIDALAIGISFAFLRVAIIVPAIIIGVITFILSFCGTFLGNRIGHFFESKIEAVAGCVLIVIGLKILVEHIIL